MKPIARAVEAFFAANTWPIRPVPGRSAFSTRFKSQAGEWICVGEIDEDDRGFVFYSQLPLTAPSERYAAVAELASRVNFLLTYGSFELNFDNGEVRFRTVVEVPDVDLSELMVDRVVYNNIATVQEYLPAFAGVINQGLTPSAALATMLD